MRLQCELQPFGGYLDIVRLLDVNGATFNAKDNNMGTPLHDVTWNGHFEIVQFLIQNGANINF